MQQTQLLPQAIENSHALKRLLEQEFEALKAQDLSAFDGLQDNKLELLTLLTNDDVAAHLKTHVNSTTAPPPSNNGWAKVINILEDCKELRLKNQILIDRKLESIRGALRTLQSSDDVNNVEVYDRLGKIKAGRGFKRPSHA